MIGLVPLVDNFAHVGGFVGGFLCGCVVLAEREKQGVTRAVSLGFVGVVLT